MSRSPRVARSGQASSPKPSKHINRLLAACFGALLWVAPGLAQAQNAEATEEWLEPGPPLASDATSAPEASYYFDEEESYDADEFTDTDPRALDDFRPYLDPHGNWIYDSNYGQVWVPKRQVVGEEFAPYVTNGRWDTDQNGDWIWVSDYEFGWVVFHYGRWVWINDSGWAWVPGRRYAPAWVVWRVPTSASAGVIGWAPMPPSWAWHGGTAISLWMNPVYPYVFCPTGYVYHHHVHTHIIHDTHRVRYATRHTSRYYPPRGVRRGPSPRVSHVPSAARPKQRTPANPRATLAAKKSTATQLRKNNYRAKPLPGGTAQNRERAIARGGKVLPSANFSQARPRPAKPAATAQGAPKPTRQTSTAQRGRTEARAQTPTSARKAPSRPAPSRAASPRSSANQAPVYRPNSSRAAAPSAQPARRPPASATAPQAPRRAPSSQPPASRSRGAQPKPNQPRQSPAKAPSQYQRPAERGGSAPAKRPTYQGKPTQSRPAETSRPRAQSRSSAPTRSSAQSRSSAPTHSSGSSYRSSPSRAGTPSRAAPRSSSSFGGGHRASPPSRASAPSRRR